MLVPRNNFNIFDDLFDDPFFNSHESKLMKTDIKEYDDKYELMIELPGFNKEDIKMHIEDGYLVVKASTNSDEREELGDGKFLRKERYYGESSRKFYIGKSLTEDNIKANFKNGILNIELPKIKEQEKNEKKYIEID